MNYKKEMLPQFSMGKDMKNIYRTLAIRYPNGFPEVLVYDELEDGKAIMCNVMSDGRKIYSVKDCDDGSMLKLLFNEFNDPHCSDTPSFGYLPHTLTNREVSMWLIYACDIADTLGIELRQMMFFDTDEPSAYMEVLPTLISDRQDKLEMMMTIAFLLRCAWQHIYHPEWFDDYTDQFDDEEDMGIRITDIDAEAFAIKTVSMIIGVDLMKSKTGKNIEPEKRSLIQTRIGEIDVRMSAGRILKIRKTIELEKELALLTEDGKIRKADNIRAVEVYRTGEEDFMVDVVYFTDDTFETWLYRGCSREKQMMFGGMMDTLRELGMTVDDLIDANVEDYYEGYDEEMGIG